MKRFNQIEEAQLSVLVSSSASHNERGKASYQVVKPVLKARTKASQELRPSRPQGVSPGFRASLVQPSASLRPFHSRYRSVSRVGDPPPLAVATPRLRQEAFGMYVHAAARFTSKSQCNRPRRKQP